MKTILTKVPDENVYYNFEDLMEVDKERFLLYMIDGNYVYITLSKTDKKITRCQVRLTRLQDKENQCKSKIFLPMI